MAIDPQFAHQPHHPDTSNTLDPDPVEQLKAQAKIQMAQTAAQLDHSPIISGSTTPTPPHSASPILNLSSELECPSPLNSSLSKTQSGPALVRSLPPAHIAKSIPCRFYAIGVCKYGHSCAFSHSLHSSTTPPTALPSGISILPLNPPDAANLNASSSPYHGPPPAYVLPPHPAQTYEEAAVRRYYGYCESPPLPPPVQPLDSLAIPPSTSPASTTPDGPPIAPEQHAYYPPPSPHPNTTYDAYYAPPPSAISHGFPSSPHQVISYGPEVSSPGYYPFHGSIPPHNVYPPMPPPPPPHGPQQPYYEPPPPGDNMAFDGYPTHHPISLGPEDPTAPPSISLPHHPNPESMYYHHQYHPPYPPPPPSGPDGLPCTPTGDYLPSSHPPISDPDSSHYHHPPMDARGGEGHHSSFKSVDAYSGHSQHGPHESYVAPPGAQTPLPNSHGPTQPHSAHPASGSSTLRFPRHSHHNLGHSNGSRRGHHAGRGGRPIRPRLSTGPNTGTCRTQSQGSAPGNASPRPPLSSATNPSSPSGTTPPLPSLIAPDERGPRGPCSFFAENRCRFGDECIWAHVMPNGDDAREYRLNYVGPELASKDGTLGSEVGYGNKMIRKMDGFDSRSIPGYALWEKRYKEPFRRAGPPKDTKSAGGDRTASGKHGTTPLDAVISSGATTRPSMRQKVDELVQQRREGNIPGHSSYRSNRAGLSGSVRSHHPPSTHGPPPHTQLRHVVASAARTQRIPSVEDFPALRSIPSSVPEKSLSNGQIKEEAKLLDEDGSSNSGATEASGSTKATSTKDSPGLPAPKSVLPLIIEGGSFALAAARGASVPPTAIKQKPVPTNMVHQPSLELAQAPAAPPSAAAPTARLSSEVEEAFKSLDIDSSTCQVVASA